MSDISDTCKRRLLLLVQDGRDTKRWYHLMYYPLIMEGYVSWELGRGFLTEKGQEWLDES